MPSREYSVEEIKEIFQALYAEKKRVLVLEERSKEAEENLIKLKQMLATSQKKEEDFISRTIFEGLQKEKEILEEDLIENSHTIGMLQQELSLINRKFDLDKNEDVALLQQQIIKMLNKNNELEKSLEESSLHAAQLEKGMEYLRGKLSESKTDRALLQEQLNQNLEEIVREEEESRKRSKENALKYQEKLREIDILQEKNNYFEADAQASKKEAKELLGKLTEQEKIIHHLLEETVILNKLFEESSDAGRKQVQELLSKLADQDNIIEQQQEEIAVSNKLFEESTDAGRKEHEELLSKLANQEKIIQQQQEEIAVSNKLFEESLDAGKKHSEQLLNRLSDQENIIDQLQKEVENLREQPQLLKQMEELTQHYEQEKRKIFDSYEEELERYKRTQRGLEEEISHHLKNKEDFQRHLEEKERAKSKIIECEMRLQDSENQIKIAQQHLAKKLKEFTFLQEEFDREKGQKIEMERKLNSFRTQLRDLESNLETARRREREVEDMRRSQDSYRKDCEKKIAELSDKINRQQQHILLLEGIEKKYNQLSQFFQAPAASSTPAALETIPLKSEGHSDSKEEKVFKENPPVSDKPSPASKPQNYNYQFFDRE